MTAQPAVLVTGASGSVGRYVVKELLRVGQPVRVTLGSAHVAAAGAEGVRFDFHDQATWAPALDGVDRVFLMRPPAISDVNAVIAPFIGMMARQPIRQVAVLSVMGVNPAMPHWRLEKAVKQAGLPWVMLRPAFFMQNLESAYRTGITVHDRIRLPAGAARTSFIDTRDIAEVAANALAKPDAHRNVAYTLTGTEALSWSDVAAILSAELGRPICYQPISLRAARADMRSEHLPGSYITVQLLIHLVGRLGLAAKITDTLPTLLGKPGRSMVQYVHDRAMCWSPG